MDETKGLAMELSRRNFVQDVIIGGAGLMAAGAVASTAHADERAIPMPTNTSTKKYPWPAEAPEINAGQVEQEIEADVIVIGLGLAGVTAVRSAVEEGASVIVFEKSEHPNVRSGDFAVLGGKTMEAWGLGDVIDPDTVANHEMDESSYYPKRSIYLKWAKNNGEVFDWYIGAKPDLYIAESSISDIPDDVGTYLSPYFLPLPEGYDWRAEEHPTYPTSVKFSPSQSDVFMANWDKAQSEGDVQAFFGHFAEELIKDDDRVVGCYARNAKTGDYVKATAKKSVILATGDYSSNKEYMDYFCPAVNENGVTNWWPDRDVEGNPVNTGDGLRMGAWAGARIQQHHAPMIHWMGKVLGGTGMDMSPVGTAPFLMLNKRGERFMNEDVPGQQMENQIELQPDGTVYQIWDANWTNQWAAFPIKHGKATYFMEKSPANRGADPASPDDIITPEAVEAAVKAGRVYKSDTIEGLLKQLEGIDAEAAKASIERYNRLAENGNDEDFGKVATRLFPVEEGPFYGTICGLGDILVCMGGLESDEECRVYATDRSVIKGLYVAGNIQGNRFAVQYPIALKGISHAMALYYGYVAGKNAVAEV